MISEFRPQQWEARYFSTNGYSCAVVARISLDHNRTPMEWAGYMGGYAGHVNMQETLEFVADYGAKLSEEDARHFFPEFADVRYRH